MYMGNFRDRQQLTYLGNVRDTPTAVPNSPLPSGAAYISECFLIHIPRSKNVAAGETCSRIRQFRSGDANHWAIQHDTFTSKCLKILNPPPSNNTAPISQNVSRYLIPPPLHTTQHLYLKMSRDT